jgi:hypothetical protein
MQLAAGNRRSRRSRNERRALPPKIVFPEGQAETNLMVRRKATSASLIDWLNDRMADWCSNHPFGIESAVVPRFTIGPTPGAARMRDTICAQFYQLCALVARVCRRPDATRRYLSRYEAIRIRHQWRNPSR